MGPYTKDSLDGRAFRSLEYGIAIGVALLAGYWIVHVRW
jgi:hypothetical protein